MSSEWISPDPAGAGSIKRVVTKVFGHKIEASVEYTVWDPPNMYGFKSDDSPFSIAGNVKLEPEENGTQLNLERQVEASGILKILEGVVIKQAVKQDRAISTRSRF
ncbi:MAG: hypothetical protein WA996_24545 [Candidatus Promineifilaceae bacterium]